MNTHISSALRCGGLLLPVLFLGKSRNVPGEETESQDAPGREASRMLQAFGGRLPVGSDLRHVRDGDCRVDCYCLGRCRWAK